MAGQSAVPQVFRCRVVLRMNGACSLRPHHAPVVYALLANAYGIGRGQSPGLPDGLMIEAPEQGRVRLEEGQTYALGFTLLADTAGRAAQIFDAVLRGLRQAGVSSTPRPTAIMGNFSVEAVEDLVSACPWSPGAAIKSAPEQQFENEIVRVAGLQTITLRFRTPLRMDRSRCQGAGGRAPGHMFLDRDHFAPRLFVGRTLSRLRSLGFDPGVPPDLELNALDVALAENRLVWLDLSYGGGPREKRLGGAVGCVRLHVGAPELARPLVLGQYAHVGRNTAFGFGAYRIEELGPDPQDCRRAMSLVDIAFNGQAATVAPPEVAQDAGVWQQACRMVKTSAYRPDPPACLPFPCGSDGVARRMVIPSALDRALQRAVLKCLAPAVDAFLEDSSFAYRRGLSRKSAAIRIREGYRRGLRYALKADFQRFFDAVDHAELRRRLDAYLADPSLTDLLMTWVRSGSPPEADRGLPIGAPISPLLAKLFLDEFDNRVRDTGGVLVRYADDFLVLFERLEQAEACHREVIAMAQGLLLTLNEAKTASLNLDEPFEFMGFRFNRLPCGWQAETGRAPRFPSGRPGPLRSVSH